MPGKKQDERLDPAPEDTKLAKQVPEPAKNKNPKPEPSSPPQQAKDIRRHWDKFAEYVKERKTWMSHILQICDKAEEKNNELILKFIQDTDCAMLRRGDNLKLLARFAQDFFQKELKIKIMVRGNRNNVKNNDDAVRAERRALANDPLVQTAAEIFGGRLVGVRTGPRFR